jgi:DNA-binding SARP family transcriptional activator
MSAITIRLFGEFEVRCDGQRVTALGQTKAQELLAYLLLHQQGPLSRESVAACLWENAATAQSLKYLRHAVWQVKTALSASGPLPVLLTSPKWIYLNPDADFRADAVEFDRAFALARQRRGQGLDAPAAQAMEKALQMYRGELLRGWAHEWCLSLRFEFEDKYQHIASRLMDHYNARGELEAAIGVGTRALQVDPSQEGIHLRLMHLYNSDGNRIAALRQYERCVESLKTELDVAPSEPTLALYQQIRSSASLDSLENTVSDFERAESSPPRDGPGLAIAAQAGISIRLAQLLKRLEALEKELAALRTSVRENIQAVQVALNDPGTPTGRK